MKIIWATVKNDATKMYIAAKKATATGLGTVLGLLSSLAVSMLTSNNNAHALGFLTFVMLIVLIYYSMYVYRGRDKRKQSSGFIELIKRDGVRALFNSTVFSYAAVEIMLSTKGILSLWDNSYYESLSEILKNSVIIYNPEVNIIITIIMTASFYLMINTAINYINIDCEQS